MGLDITKLVLYFNLAVSVSFVCSLCEACLLTLTRADAEAIAQKRPRIGRMLGALKKDIDRPLAAILTLNTISHTVGAAGVGAEAAAIFGGWVGVTSAVLTFIILVFSEIVPKTIGAVHARSVAPVCVVTVHWMIVLMYPIVSSLEVLSGLLKRKGDTQTPIREEIMILAELAHVGGGLDVEEARAIQNMLKLKEMRAADVMTPRTVVFMLGADRTVDEVLQEHSAIAFSRIPIFGSGPDDILGLVLRKDIYETAYGGKRDTTLRQLQREFSAVPATASLFQMLRQFSKTQQHLFFVVDEYGGTAGVITLEDVMETMLGTEIVDETDVAADLQALAKRRSRLS